MTQVKIPTWHLWNTYAEQNPSNTNFSIIFFALWCLYDPWNNCYSLWFSTNKYLVLIFFWNLLLYILCIGTQHAQLWPVPILANHNASWCLHKNCGHHLKNNWYYFIRLKQRKKKMNCYFKDIQKIGEMDIVHRELLNKGRKPSKQTIKIILYKVIVSKIGGFDLKLSCV